MELDIVFDDSIELEMTVSFTESVQESDVDFGEVQIVNIGAEPYKGDYTVTPKVNAQTMLTRGKLMDDDVKISPIPYFDVGNASGGSTVYIGGEE